MMNGLFNINHSSTYAEVGKNLIGDVAFKRKSAATGTVISAGALDHVIATITARELGGKAWVVAPTFNDLPAPVVAYAKKTGYDDKAERISAVVYDNKIYVVQANIPSELEVVR